MWWRVAGGRGAVGCCDVRAQGPRKQAVAPGASALPSAHPPLLLVRDRRASRSAPPVLCRSSSWWTVGGGVEVVGFCCTSDVSRSTDTCGESRPGAAQLPHQASFRPRIRAQSMVCLGGCARSGAAPRGGPHSGELSVLCGEPCGVRRQDAVQPRRPPVRRVLPHAGAHNALQHLLRVRGGRQALLAEERDGWRSRRRK
jgi:hypothetical protein